MDIGRLQYRMIIFSIALFLLSSCNTSKFLAPSEKIIVKNKISISKNKDTGQIGDLNYQLSTLVAPKPNKKFFGLTKARLWFYFKTKDKQDPSKITRWIQRKIAEPPALYNPDRLESSKQSIKNYLQHRGFWNATVRIDTAVTKKKMRVTYEIIPQSRYYFDKVTFESPDQNIERILNQTRKKAFLKEGQPVDYTAFNKEVQRVTQTLRDSGYAFFYPNYIDQLEVDTNAGKVNAVFRVLPYKDTTTHPTFEVGKVSVFPSFRASQKLYSYSISKKNVDFLSEDGDFGINLDVLLDQIYLKNGQKYKQSDFDKTNKQIRNLDLYRFIAIDQEIDSLRPDRLNFDIRLIPKKKWALGYDFDLNTSIQQGNSLIGGAVNLNLKNRNLFKGGELLDFNLQLGIELPRDFRSDIINTFENRVQAELTIPKFVDPFRFYRILKGLKILGRKRYDQLVENSTSNITLSNNFVSLVDFYQYNQFNFTFGYNIQPNPFRTIRINHLGLDYLDTRPFSNFQAIIKDNPFLENSFVAQQVFSGIILRNLEYFWRKDVPQTNDYWFFKGAFELSGLEVHAINSLTNALRPAERRDTFNFFGIPLAKFFSIDLDGQYLKKFKNKSALSFRINSGIAIPYGSSAEVPYVKQFFVGGPNSIRAWRIRELGPGGYLDPNPPAAFYQTGDFKLEFTAEYRFNIFWRFNGALFLDGGNVWTLSKDENRIGSQLRWNREVNPENGLIIQDNFLNQIALGAGFGLRVDFTYFIVRLDMGYPIRNNYPKPGDPYKNAYWTIREASDFRLDNLNFNLAIGYPFMNYIKL